MGKTRSGSPAGGALAGLGLPGSPGVGGRQGDLFASEGGGGYLDECNPSELRECDVERAKIRELEKMGLPRLWVRVAQRIGFDNFHELWVMLDEATETEELEVSDNQTMILVKLRRHSSYRRYQRNRYIEALAQMGRTNTEIERILSHELGEKLSRTSISRIALPKRGRIAQP